MRVLRSCIVAGLLTGVPGLGGGKAYAADLLRGPYLQTAASDGIMIRWRTDVATSSQVFFGEQTNNLPFSVSELDPKTDHEVWLSGLLPATRYYYAVGSTNEILAEGGDCWFVTSPVTGTPKPTHIWVVGDSGGFYQGHGNPLAVRNAYYQYAWTRRPDVWLLLGDNAYDSGTDLEYQKDFFEIYPSMFRQTAPWSTIGNHESYILPPGQLFPYENIFSFPTNGEAGGVASGTERYYSFDHGNIHFICLDSQTQNRATNGAMADWLRADLATTSNQWMIAFWHHPPYTKGSHDSDAPYETEIIEMRESILPILEGGGVDLVLSGHSHNYERSYLMRGHYGNSTNFSPEMILDQGSGRENDTGAYIKPTFGPLANQGTVYVVAGSANHSVMARYGHHPAMFADESQLGSMALKINSNRLDGVFLRETGAIDDSFTIIKGNPEPLRLCPFILQNGKTIVRWKSTRGLRYRVEQTESLQTPDWRSGGDVVVAVGATTSWTNDIPAGTTANFYRIKQLSP